jgi:hypothetical protein
MPYLKDKNVKFAFDEWAPRNARINQSAPPGPGNPMLNTLSGALVYHEFFRHSDMAALAVATGGMMTLASDAHGDAVGYRLDGLLLKLFHDRFAGTLPVAITGNSPPHTIQGTVAVDLCASLRKYNLFSGHLFFGAERRQEDAYHFRGPSHRDSAGLRSDAYRSTACRRRQIPAIDGPGGKV